MILKDMAEHVSEVIGSPDAETVKQATRFLKRRYEMLYDSHLWEDAKVPLSLTTYDAEVVLPSWVDRVLQVVECKDGTERNLPHMDLQNIYQIDPSLLEDEGEVVGFSRKHPIATSRHPAGNRVKFQSSSGSDAEIVRLEGIHNGNEIHESVTLAGTTSVTSQNYYDELRTFSKPVTVGFVKMRRDNTNEDEIAVLLGDENSRTYNRIQLHRSISETDGRKLLILAKQRCIPLRHDNDAPQLGNCENALISFAVSDCLNRMRQTAKAQAHIQEANAHVASMMDRDKNQQASVLRFVPEG